MITVAVHDTKPYDREHLKAAAAGDAEAVCVFVNDQLDRPCLEALAGQGVRLVALGCTGFNNVDLAAARELGLTVTRVPLYSPHAVAEHAVALLLCLNRRIHRSFNRVREQNFSLQGLVGSDLHGKTAGVVGTGKIGRIVARILRGFGMTVVAYDPYEDPEWAAGLGVSYVAAEALAARSDVITLHIPLTTQTHHLIRRETIALMKAGAILINVSRGALADTTALIEALKSGRLGGVALDVYEEEEGVFFEDLSGQILQDDELARLLTFPNVLVTAHQAFLTHDALGDISRTTAANLEALASGAPFVEGSVLT